MRACFYPRFQILLLKVRFAHLQAIGEIESREHLSDYEADLAKLKGKKSVWFIFSHNYTRLNIDEDKYIVNSLNTIGLKLMK
jgi:hypothetical protein